MQWQSAAQHLLMWGIRYTPVPWKVKRHAIRLAIPRMIVVGTALIPDDEGRILMLRARYSGRWIPPGGAVHPGEDPLTGTRRECREELGCEVEVSALLGLYSVATTGEMFIAFRCAPLAGPPRLGAEHEAFRYFPPHELPWWVRAICQDTWRDDLPAPVVRTLAGPADTQ